MTNTLSLTLFLVFTLIPCFIVAQTPENETLIEILTPTFAPANEAALVAFPDFIVDIETPLAVRFALLGIVSGYVTDAACHPKALNFLGKKDPISPELCNPTPHTIMGWYVVYHLMESQFPTVAAGIGDFLERNGLEPRSTSTDVSTEIGWVNVYTAPLVSYFENDGWNSIGDKTRLTFRRPYEDTTGYKPQNTADTDPGFLRFPLRWQPLTQPLRRFGSYATQVHVTPHLGLLGEPMVLSKEQIEAKRVSSPYKSPNLEGKIGQRDLALMRRQLNELFQRNRALTRKQVALAHWWNSKFFSLGSFVGVYQDLLKYDDKELLLLALGEALAQNDALIVAWKEKVRHDLVRPTTMVRRLLKGQTIQAFKNLEEGVGPVKAEDWEPVLEVMPHSEYPSGSAILCTASMDHLRVGLAALLGPNEKIPPFQTVITPNFPPSSPVDVNITVRFETLEEAAKSCGESRLFAGVHFGPSVPAGEKLAEGIGEAAYKHIRDLHSGKVPDSCERCKKR